MANPTFVASSTGGGINTTVAIAKPTGTADGDLLLAFLTIGVDSPAPTSTGSGYTLIARTTSNTPVFYVYAKIANSEPATENWGAGVGFVVIRHAWRPSSGSWTTIYDAIYSVNHENNGDPQSTAYGLSYQGTMDVAAITFFSTLRPDQAIGAPSGYTLAGDIATPGGGFDNANHPHAGGAYKLVTAGTVSSATWSNSGGRPAASMQMGIIDPPTTRNIGFYGFLGGNRNQLITSGTPLTVYFPAHKQNCLLGILLFQKAGTVTAPTGWAATTDYVNAAGVHLRMFTKTATADSGAWETSVALTTSGINDAGALAMVFQPNNTVIAESGLADDSDNTTHDVPGLAASAAPSVLLAISNLHRGDGSGFTADPAGFSYVTHVPRGSSVGMHMRTTWKSNASANPAATAYSTTTAYTSTGMQIMIAAQPPSQPISVSQQGSSGNLNLGFTAVGGRLLIAAMGIREWNRTFTPSGGWQVIARRENVDPGQMHGWVLAKVATGGETAITGTFNGPGPVVTASIEVVGASINGALDGGWQRGNTTTILAPPVTPLSGREAIIVACLNGDNRNVTAGVGYTGVGGTFPPSGETDWPRVMLAYKIVSPTTGSYQPQGTISPADEWTGVSAVFYQSITGTGARFSVIFIL